MRMGCRGMHLGRCHMCCKIEVGFCGCGDLGVVGDDRIAII